MHRLLALLALTPLFARASGDGMRRDLTGSWVVIAALLLFFGTCLAVIALGYAGSSAPHPAFNLTLF